MQASSILLGLVLTPPGTAFCDSVSTPAPPQDGAAAMMRGSMPAKFVVSFPPIECPRAPIRLSSTSGIDSSKLMARRAAIKTTYQLLLRGET